MSQSNAILGLLTETSLHAGVGQTVGVIDLPIQREAHTNWPFVYGSSVKGSMRTLAESKWSTELDKVKSLFGPEMAHGESQTQAGGLAIGDARLLFLPVRSLTSHFKWVTCPDLLRRYQADCRRLGMPETFTIPEISEKETALVSTQHDLDFGLFLEEFRFTGQPHADLDELITRLAPLMGREDAKKALEKQLVIVNDDLFRHITDYATPLNAHIQLNNETKASDNLWYEETLPSDTLLYVTLVAQPVYLNEALQTANNLMGWTQQLFSAEHA
ncbi:MAG: type III-B CRISPR module RAMP protein Cmr4 [Candidatus Parabeggiatoa sp.]|nr:type III-B CRISPR module RAMP protein Cmr4 [Candidatus Parabeggiatoa sp.]